jgi:hypothetical protein
MLALLKVGHTTGLSKMRLDAEEIRITFQVFSEGLGVAQDRL